MLQEPPRLSPPRELSRNFSSRFERLGSGLSIKPDSGPVDNYEGSMGRSAKLNGVIRSADSGVCEDFRRAAAFLTTGFICVASSLIIKLTSNVITPPHCVALVCVLTCVFLIYHYKLNLPRGFSTCTLFDLGVHAAAA